MRQVLVLAVMVGVAGGAAAQERIPPDQAQQYARLMAETASKVAAPAVKTDVDAEKPFGLKHGEIGVLVIPERTLSEEALSKAGKTVVPVGQLWVRNLTLVLDGSAISNDRLQVLTVTADNQDHRLPLFLLGARKGAKDALELVVYAKDKEPLAVVPLQKIQATQELPIELEGKRGDGETATLTLNLLGKYRAAVTVGRQEQ